MVLVSFAPGVSENVTEGSLVSEKRLKVTVCFTVTLSRYGIATLDEELVVCFVVAVAVILPVDDLSSRCRWSLWHWSS